MTKIGFDLDALAQALHADGHACVQDLLDASLLHDLAADCARSQAEGSMRAAAVGRGEGLTRDANVRGDSILWLDPGTADAQRALFARLDSLRVELNRRLMLGLHELEAHYAVYAPGRGYARHRDRFRDDDARVLSIVIYLNDEWPDDAGGELRLHLPSGTRDVAPRAGTSVFFLSAEIEHEVRPARRERRSIAGWFRRRA